VLKGIPKLRLCFVGKELPSFRQQQQVPQRLAPAIPSGSFRFLLSVDRRTVLKAGTFKIPVMVYSLPTESIIHLCLRKGQDRQNLVCEGCGCRRESPEWVVLHPARDHCFPGSAEGAQLSGRSAKGNMQGSILQSLCSCCPMKYL